MADLPLDDASAQLTPEQMVPLFERAKAGDEGARWDLILGNMPLVVFVAKRIGVTQPRYSNHIVEDVLSHGQQILMETIDSFDLAQGVRFSTYAVPILEHEMRREAGRSGALSEVPHHVRTLFSRIERTRKQLARENQGVEPTLEDIAAKLNLTDAERHNYESARKLREGTVRLGAMDDDEGGRSHQIADPASMDRDDSIAQEEQYAQLQSLLGEIDPEIARVVAARFGIGVDEPITIAAAMAELGVNKVEMRRIESETLQELIAAAQGNA